ncbi:MAG: hypothetical protein H0T60_13590, partial [Acidobacteria bacterium]|nr:hypothetical protein [Acidobacteriota bacterium]
MTLFSATTLAQDGGAQSIPPNAAQASGGIDIDEAAPTKPVESAPVSESPRPAPPPEVGVSPPAEATEPPAEQPPPTLHLTAPSVLIKAALSGASAALGSSTTTRAQQPGVAIIAPPEPEGPCAKTITANVVAFDQVYTYNRFGAFNPGGMMYALKRDVVAIEGTEPGPGNAQLRPDKRPRPIVLRVNEGDCLQVTFTNWLTEKAELVEDLHFNNQPEEQPYPHFPVRLRKNNTTTTRTASMHVNGLDYVNGPNEDDGAFVGNNASSMAGVGQSKIYTWFAAKQGQYLLYSMGAPSGNEGDNGQAGLGLFGSVNVEPPGARWYRSQVTHETLRAAYARTRFGVVLKNENGTPRINYEAVYKG